MKRLALLISLLVLAAAPARAADPATKCFWHVGDDSYEWHALSADDSARVAALLADFENWTPDPAWHFTGWSPSLPTSVPGEATTYRANYVSTGVRVIRVVPLEEAPETQDGLTWETAYADLAAAYAELRAAVLAKTAGGRA